MSKTKTVLLLAAVTLAWVAAVTAVHAVGAEDLQYDDSAAARRFNMIRLYLETRRCMTDGSLAMLREGVRSRAAVTTFAVTACGSAFRRELITGPGKFSPDHAERILHELAETSLNEVLSR